MSRPKITVSLRVRGDNLVPNEITAALMRQPSSAVIKGQDIVSGGFVRQSPTGVWLLKLPDNQTDMFDDQVRIILNMVSSDLETWHKLSERFSTELFVGVFLSEINQGFESSPSTMQEIVKRGLRIAFDIYYAESPSERP